MAENTMLMTNGVHVVPVVRSAFELVWSKRGFMEAPEGVEETPRVLGLEDGETIDEFQAKQAEVVKKAEAEAEELRTAVEAKVKELAVGTTTPAGGVTDTPSADTPPNPGASGAPARDSGSSVGGGSGSSAAAGPGSSSTPAS